MGERLARTWFGVTAACVLVAVAVQVGVSAATPGVFATPAGRVFNLFCYFTIQSNLIVGISSLLLFLRLDRESTAFRVFRLSGVVAIAVTGVVYHAVLRDLYELTGWAVFCDVLLHTIVPILGVGGWVVFGPRGQTSYRVAGLTTIFPIAWFAFTLAKGPIVNFYPYPFVDVSDLGYARVGLNAVGVAVLFVGLAAGLTAVDGWLARRFRVLSPT